MVWCRKNKFIFIHIPKTGGETVERILELYGRQSNGWSIIEKRALQHWSAIEYYFFFGKEIYNDYYRFTIVRNPISRCISEYYFKDCPIGYHKDNSFDEFLENLEDIIRNDKYYESLFHDHFKSQTSYILYKNQLLVDKIFKFEEYSEIVNFIYDKKWQQDETKKNIHSQKAILIKNPNHKIIHQKKLIPTEEQKKKIYELYKEDFINFNYIL